MNGEESRLETNNSAVSVIIAETDKGISNVISFVFVYKAKRKNQFQNQT